MFMNDLSIVVRKACVYAERQFATEDLGFPELVIIMYLSDSGPSNQEQIAHFFEVDKGAISKTIGKLEGKGLVTRTVNPDNRREKQVSLEPNALETVEKMRTVLANWEKIALDGVDEENRATAVNVLAKMAANSSDLVDRAAADSPVKPEKSAATSHATHDGER